MILVISLWEFTWPSVYFSASSMRTHGSLPEPQPRLFLIQNLPVSLEPSQDSREKTSEGCTQKTTG